VLSSACALALALALDASVDRRPATPIDRPFHQLFTNLGRDARAMPSAETAMILGAGGLGALALGPADDDLSGWAGSRGPSRYTSLGRVLGDGWVQSGAAVVTYAIGVAARRPTATHVGSDLIRAQLLNGVVTRGLKLAVGRSRPSGGGSSFPSGHSSAAFASAAVLDAHFGWKVGMPAYAAAGFIGWTRVRDDAHWLSDVVVGGTVGAIVGRTIARGHGSRAWMMLPSASQASVALLVVRRPGERAARRADRRAPGF
jgi:membrane-associated phospholipid phosphatase